MLSICFILLLLISILTQSYGQMTCAPGWVEYGGSCYLFDVTYRTWDDCNAHCSTSYPGATMFCVNNLAEKDWINSHYRASWYWIGYTDMLPYGGGKGTKQYGWVTGCSSTYTNWWTAGGQPDNQWNNEDYVVVNYGSSQWWDTFGSQLNSCGCQLNSSPAMTTAAPSSDPTVAPSSGPTSSPNATPSFRPSVGDVSE